jgi:acyl-CoA reductase-like NAD-dependent aldehyde dehydrogenase
MVFTRTPEIKYTKLFINNEWVSCKSGKKLPVINPATGKQFAEVDEGSKEDVELAVAAAVEAFKDDSVWRQMDASERGRLMHKLADAMEANRDYLASLESVDNGKPVLSALGDVDFSVATLRYYAGWADKIHGKTIPADGGVFTMTLVEPVGVCGQVIPWNYPILMTLWKWAPALATGCTLVLKPSEKTPLSVLALCGLVKEVGIPAGVINVINGYGPTVGEAIVTHPLIDKVAFTGSTAVGRKIQALAAGKRVSLEMGGKSPLVIMPDCDLDVAAETAHEGAMVNMGQCCIAATRTFVHEAIYDKFVQRSKELALKRKVGDPFDDKTIQGPQVDDIQYKKVVDYMEKGKKEGATLVAGGNVVNLNGGYFVEPTVFANVTDDMTICKEEIFGPVQSIIKFKTLDEAIKRANETQYGLGAGIMTNDIDTALKFAKRVKAGGIFVNNYNFCAVQNPFGGYKASGHGRELGEDGLKEYLEVKTVTIMPLKK